MAHPRSRCTVNVGLAQARPNYRGWTQALQHKHTCTPTNLYKQVKACMESQKNKWKHRLPDYKYPDPHCAAHMHYSCYNYSSSEGISTQCARRFRLYLITRVAAWMASYSLTDDSCPCASGSGDYKSSLYRYTSSSACACVSLAACGY